MAEFHFIRPEWFWALLPLVLLLTVYYYRRAAAGDWDKIIDPQLQPYMIIGNNRRQRRWPLSLLGIAGLLSIVALAGPSWERLPQPVFKAQSALVILLDLSRSMDSQDVKPSRLRRAHHKITDVLQQREEGQTALLVFAAQTYTVTPLTDDTDTINAHIPTLTTDLMPAQGSRPDLAIEKALEIFKQANTRDGKVLLITDGIDTNATQTAADKLTAAGHQLLILGIGTTDGAPIPLGNGGFLKSNNGSIVIPKLSEQELKRFGKYRRLSIDDSDINALLNETIEDPLNLNAEKTEIETDTWRDEGPWLLLPLLLLAPLGFRRGILVFAFIVLLPLPQTSYAFEWDSLWRNSNQRGADALAAGEAEKASELFNDPEWRAAAHYRAGQYENTLSALENIDTPDALYNKGNALAKLGRIPEAIEAYEQTLSQQPDHEDAKHNRDLLMQQQQANPEQTSDQQQADPNNAENPQNQSKNGDTPPAQPEQENNQNDTGNPDTAENQQPENNPEQSPEQPPEQPQTAETETPEPQDTQPQQADAEQQLKEQWLQRIPDDPGGLLRRKFLYQYRQQAQPEEEQPW